MQVYDSADASGRRKRRNTRENMCRAFARLEETERRHVAREIHDVMGQSSTVLKLLIHRATNSPDQTMALLKEAGAIVDEMVSWSRNFMQDIQVQVLREAGLVTALGSYLRRYTARHNVPVKFSHANVPGDLSHETSIAVYRIVQECLADVARHGALASAEVQLRAEGKRLRLQVCCASKGEVPATDEGLSSVTGIIERVDLLGGDLRLDSPAGSGMCVLVKLPLSCR